MKGGNGNGGGGGNNNDGVSFIGTNGNDIITTGDGNDFIDGKAGDDIIDAGAGNDTIQDGSGDDVIDAGDGDDTIILGSGADTVDGGDGIDTLRFFGDWIDLSTGTSSDGDQITGVENLWGAGGGHSEILTGDDGDNFIKGFSGDDVLNGKGGDDRLEGGRDDDVLNGGAGNDVLNGGKGADSFVFEADGTGDADIIEDFNSRQDSLVLDGVEISAVTDDGTDTIVTLADGEGTIALLGVVLEEADLIA